MTCIQLENKFSAQPSVEIVLDIVKIVNCQFWQFPWPWSHFAEIHSVSQSNSLQLLTWKKNKTLINSLCLQFHGIVYTFHPLFTCQIHIIDCKSFTITGGWRKKYRNCLHREVKKIFVKHIYFWDFFSLISLDFFCAPTFSCLPRPLRWWSPWDWTTPLSHGF